MKRTYVRILPVGIALLAFMNLGQSCPSDPEVVTAVLNEEFQLGVGQAAVLHSDNLTITFEMVTDDSRCPEGVDCPWAGDATVLLNAELAREDGVATESLELHTNLDPSTVTVFEVYAVSLLALDPYPVYGETIDPGEYVATLVVSRPKGEVVPAELDQPFDLPVGQSASIETDQLTIDFVTVVDDSRCPIGVSCVWEGDGVIEIFVQQVIEGAVIQDKFELHTYDGFDTEIVFKDYVVALVELSPHPVYGETIDPSDYVATLLVKHQSTDG